MKHQSSPRKLRSAKGFVCTDLACKIECKRASKTFTDADYADDIAILANTPDQAETLQHSLERTSAGIGLYVNAHKTEYMCDNQTGDITTLDGTPLKLVDKFTYTACLVSLTWIVFVAV